MKTLKRFADTPPDMPMTAGWYLADIERAIGKQDLYTRQSPQKLKVLREHALIESAVSSNRIEGVEVDQSRIGTLIFGKTALKDRDEEEVRGYRDALNLIHMRGAKLTLNEAVILDFHRRSRGQIWDAGKYKEKDGDIIETYADGRSRVRFKTVPAKQTPRMTRDCLSLYEELRNEERLPQMILLAALNLDFLCIHPFRDGNGRVSRLLLLLSCYQAGAEVGRYISLERLIEENKERYYETLELSSQGWHQGKHDPWPYIGFLLYILRSAYQEFENRFDQSTSPRGSKAELVESSVRSQVGEFRLADIKKACPGVGREWIRTLLGQMRKDGIVVCQGKGPAARWIYQGNKKGKGTTST